MTNQTGFDEHSGARNWARHSVDSLRREPSHSKLQATLESRIGGFGNHNPGAGRYEGKILLWDIIHPGRDWAPNLKPRANTKPDTKPELEERARDFLAKNEPPDDPRLRFKADGKIDDGLV